MKHVIKTPEKAIQAVERSAEALQTYAIGIRLLEWLKDNDLLNSEETIEALAYAFAVQNTDDVVRANLAFLPK